MPSNCLRSWLERRAEHGLDRSVVTLDQELQQAPQPLGLDAVVTGRPDQFLQFFLGHFVQGVGIQQVGLAEVADRPLDVLPVRVLHQDRADHHFKMAIARPPLLWAKGVEQPLVDFLQNDTHGKLLEPIQEP